MGKDAFEELNNLIGLNSLKADVMELVRFVNIQQLRKQKNMKTVPVSLHLVFSGNPGTGKTTVARILAQIYNEIGVLSKGQLVEVDRSALVAGYVGQTALKTQEKIQEALGGILFIDEAYTLVKDGNDYGQEAIDTILKAMEDHRDDFIVIVAGYSDLMVDFINSNPGLRSRFNKFMNFSDYNENELMEIFASMCKANDYYLADSAEAAVQSYLSDMVNNKGNNFANARDVRNLFENIITNQATRIFKDLDLSETDFMTITEEDFCCSIGMDTSREGIGKVVVSRPSYLIERPEESEKVLQTESEMTESDMLYNDVFYEHMEGFYDLEEFEALEQELIKNPDDSYNRLLVIAWINDIIHGCSYEAASDELVFLAKKCIKHINQLNFSPNSKPNQVKLLIVDFIEASMKFILGDVFDSYWKFQEVCQRAEVIETENKESFWLCYSVKTIRNSALYNIWVIKAVINKGADDFYQMHQDIIDSELDKIRKIYDSPRISNSTDSRVIERDKDMEEWRKSQKINYRMAIFFESVWSGGENNPINDIYDSKEEDEIFRWKSVSFGDAMKIAVDGNMVEVYFSNYSGRGWELPPLKTKWSNRFWIEPTWDII